MTDFSCSSFAPRVPVRSNLGAGANVTSAASQGVGRTSLMYSLSPTRAQRSGDH